MSGPDPNEGPDGKALACLRAWRRLHASEEDRHSFCTELKKASASKRDEAYRSCENGNPFVAVRFGPLLRRECKIPERTFGASPMRRSERGSASDRLDSASPSRSEAASASSARASSDSSSASSGSGPSAGPKSRAEEFDISDCSDFEAETPCEARRDCKWTGDHCLPRRTQHFNLDTEVPRAEKQARRARALPLLGVFGLASAVSAPGLATALRAPEMAAPVPLARQQAAMQRAAASRLLREKPLRPSGRGLRPLPGSINRTPMDEDADYMARQNSWVQRLGAVLTGRAPRR